MARESVIAPRPHRAIRNPVRGGFAVLTPQVFRRIDVIARRHAGRPFRVKKAEEMDGAWGRCDLMVDDTFRDLRKLSDRRQTGSVYAEIGILDISNVISVAKFHRANRPEIDLSKIPAERIYEFVAWHEIGHVVDNFDHWAPILQSASDNLLRDEPTWKSVLGKLNEVLADRFAWDQMFPGILLPVRDGCANIAAWTDSWASHLEAAGVRRGRDAKWAGISIDTHALTYVPTCHVRKRIAWSALAEPEVSRAAPWLQRLKQARQEDANRALRWTRQHAKETAALMLELVAKKPTMGAYRAMCQGNIVSYVHKMKWRHEMRAAEGVAP